MIDLSLLLRPLERLCAGEGLPAPRLEFSRKGKSHVSCPVALSLGRGAQCAAQNLAQAWNRDYSHLASAQAQAGFLNLTLTQEALLALLDALPGEGEDAPIRWEEPQAPTLLRLRADRAFAVDVPFSPEAALALLRAAAGLPYDPHDLHTPLHPAISRAWERMLRKG